MLTLLIVLPLLRRLLFAGTRLQALRGSNLPAILKAASPNLAAAARVDEEQRLPTSSAYGAEEVWEATSAPDFWGGILTVPCTQRGVLKEHGRAAIRGRN